jgi:pyridoxamine 5'-phosphate oxidase
VEARYVNLKYIFGNEWVFFTNYNSPKAKQFNEHSQISAVFYWECINVQIKIKAKIFKTDKDFSDKHFSKRSKFKNAVSISSNQSKTIKSYEALKEKYDHYIENNTCMNRPDYWGGFSFTPYYFEFWEGHESRLNKREVYEKSDDSWRHLILQP